MSTWIGAVVETRGRADLWALMRRHGIKTDGVGAPPAFVLIEGTPALSALVPPAFSEALSRDAGGMVLGFFAQTNADVYELQCFRGGECVRLLKYVRDDGGWIRHEGEVQPWERSFFFAGDPTAGADELPYLLDAEVSDVDRARYEAAKRSGDASTVFDLLRPSSTAVLQRLCGAFGVDPTAPAGRWRPPRSARAWLIPGAVILFFVGMFLLGALTGGSPVPTSR
ncbi:MAG: hypothetical protein U0326_44170 [Polyangiales bacterium]